MMADNETFKVLNIKEIEHKNTKRKNNSLSQAVIIEMINTQTEALKEIAAVLNEFKAYNKKLKNSIDEMHALREEVYCMKKKLDQDNYQKLISGNTLLINRLEELEKYQAESQVKFAVKTRQIQEIKLALSELKKPWWQHLF